MNPGYNATAPAPDARHEGWATLRRFIPYLWPKDNMGLRWRIVGALLLILAAKATLLLLPFAYKRAVDVMGGKALEAAEPALTVAFAFVMVAFDVFC